MINMGLKHNAITTRIKYDKTKICQQKFKIKIRTKIKYDIKIWDVIKNKTKQYENNTKHYTTQHHTTLLSRNILNKENYYE